MMERTIFNTAMRKNVVCIYMVLIVVMSSSATASFASISGHGTGQNFSQTMTAKKSQLEIPLPVTGLVIKINDPLVKSITLSWKANPKSEGVDKYAIYSQSVHGPLNDPGQLIAITSQTRITLKTYYNGNSDINQPPHSVFIDPTLDVNMWVMPHNKYGWGETIFNSPYPDHYKQIHIPPALVVVYAPNRAFGVWFCTSAIVKYYDSGHC